MCYHGYNKEEKMGYYEAMLAKKTQSNESGYFEAMLERLMQK